MKYLGIDLGGTNVTAAVMDSEGTILGKVSLPTPRGAEAVADQMAVAVRGAVEAAGTALDEVVSVGIGTPDAIKPDTGVIKYWSNLDSTNMPITALMKARLDKEILPENDANAAALGEYAAGAGKGSQSMVVVTLGTGVGGGTILNGKLYTGFNYAGMEIGHFVIEHDGWLYTCGYRGCFEAYCPATTLIKRIRQVMGEDRASRLWELARSLERVNGRTPFDAAAQGNLATGKVIDEYVDYLDCGVASLVSIFQPEVICIGGGPSVQGKILMAPVRYILNRENYACNNLHRTRLVQAALGNDVGLTGAALLPLFR